MMNLLAANTVFGLVPFEGTWLVVTVILCVIGLIVIGYLYDDDTGPFIILEGCVVIAIAIFWGFLLVFAIGVGIVAIPILIGFYGRKMKIKRAEKKKMKLESMNDIDKMKKSRK